MEGSELVPVPGININLLAREIAIGVHTLPDILERFNLTDVQYGELSREGRFIALVESIKQEWQSAINTPERVKVEAAAMFEQFLPHLHKRLHEDSEPLNHVVEGAKLVARAAGIGDAKDMGSNSEKVSITIKLAENKQVTIDAVPAMPQSNDGTT